MKRGPKTTPGKLTIAKNGESTLWNASDELKEAINVARRLRNTKHGLYASVPIICKGDECPYKENCYFWLNGDAPVSEKCPIEIAAIEDLFERYCKDLNINPEDMKQTVDALMVKELVDIDVALLRCDSKMAINADFIIENVVSVTDSGNAVYRQELHPMLEYKERLRASKYKTLQLLNSTRKDKEGSKIHIELDPSEKAAEMMRLKRDLEIIDVEAEEDEKKYEDKFVKKEIISIEPIDYN
jgi:hypothetical protein